MSQLLLKAILIISFGTSYEDTRIKTIDAVENEVREAFPEYTVRGAFTSHRIIRILKERDGIRMEKPEEALEKLRKEGVREVIVQPLHVIPGHEFEYVKEIVRQYEKHFSKITLGRPLLYYMGQEERFPDDYSILINAVKSGFPETGRTLLMGHGTTHPSNAVYSCFQNKLLENGINNVFIACVEGYPALEDLLPRLENMSDKPVNLMPFMLVAGDHARNDLAGDEEDSWKCILERENYNVGVQLKGLGEYGEVRDIYIQHIRDAIENRFFVRLSSIKE